MIFKLILLRCLKYSDFIFRARVFNSRCCGHSKNHYVCGCVCVGFPAPNGKSVRSHSWRWAAEVVTRSIERAEAEMQWMPRYESLIQYTVEHSALRSSFYTYKLERMENTFGKWACGYKWAKAKWLSRKGERKEWRRSFFVRIKIVKQNDQLENCR